MPDYDRPILEGDIYKEVLARPLVSSQTFLVRRELMEQVGGWHETIRKGEDWELSARLARVARYAFIEEPLSITFLGDDSATHNELKGVGTMKAILEANAETYDANPDLHAGLLIQITRTYQRNRKFSEAAPYLKKTIALRTSFLPILKLAVAQIFRLGPVFKKRARQKN
jgi:hypothetical protein